MTIPERAPRGLRWLETPAVRSLTTFVAVVALVASALLGIRQQSYISCVAEQQALAAERTRALAAATDAERAADTQLVAGERPGGPSAAQLRAASVAARAVTDRVRAQNPPPPLRRC